jgi:type IV pilus assembly protein PilW
MRYAMNQLSIKPARRIPVRSGRRESGFTLIELMIAIALGLLILAGMATIFANTNATRNEVDRMSRQIENGRYATELLRDDLRHAGYYGELDATAVALPGSLPDACSTTLATWAGALRIHVQGVNNYTSGDLSCLPADVKPGTDVIVVRRVNATPECLVAVAGCAAAVVGVPYLQIPLCSTETTTHTLDIKAAANFNVHKRKDCTTAAALRKFALRIYYISTNNGSGQNVPTLMRADFTGGGFVISPQVEGIEDMQVRYGVDTDNDGDPDSYANAAGVASVANWSNVVTVEVGLLARNIDPSPNFTDTKTYKLLDVNLAAFTGADASYRRHVYTTLVRLQNPSGRRDTP